jgi:hypothetical protein
VPGSVGIRSGDRAVACQDWINSAALRRKTVHDPVRSCERQLMDPSRPKSVRFSSVLRYPWSVPDIRPLSVVCPRYPPAIRGLSPISARVPDIRPLSGSRYPPDEPEFQFGSRYE